MPLSGSYFYPQATVTRSPFPSLDTPLIRNLSGPLILSSSDSLIRASGSLGLHKADSAALPAGSDILSGAILWVDNLKQFAIYGPNGWCRITTGSVVS